MHPSDTDIDSEAFNEYWSNSYQHFLKLIKENKISTGSRADGNPNDNDVLLLVMNKHKRGFFENIHKLVIRASHESVESLELLWNAHLIGFQDVKTKEQFTYSNTGPLLNFFKKIENLT